MKQRDYVINLYEIYKGLLTKNQAYYFENYYFEDLSLAEISENNNVSRAFVSKTVNLVVNKLLAFENNLKIYENKQKLNKIINSIEDENIKEKLNELI